MYFDRELKSCFAHSKLLPAFVLRKLIDYARMKRLLNSTDLLHVYHLLLVTHAAMFNSECVRNTLILVRFVADNLISDVLTTDFCGIDESGHETYVCEHVCL